MCIIPSTVQMSASNSVIFLTKRLVFFPWFRKTLNHKMVGECFQGSIILSLPSSTFPCVSVTCHCQGQGTGLDNLWSDPGSLLFLYAQVIIEGFIRVHKCKCGNFERDWRRTYQRLHSYTFSAKSRVFKGLVSSRGSCLQEFRVNKFLSLRLLLLKIR